jgi:hypothetical protein
LEFQSRLARDIGKNPIATPDLIFFFFFFLFFSLFPLSARDGVFTSAPSIFPRPTHWSPDLKLLLTQLESVVKMAAPENGRKAQETTPLLSNGAGNDNDRSTGPETTVPAGDGTADRWQHLATPEMRLLMAAFLITTGLCFTQVPYVATRSCLCAGSTSR